MPTDRQAAPFLLFCAKERRSQYEQVLSTGPHPVEVAEELTDLLGRCIKTPPKGVLIDIPTSAKLGAALVNPLLQFRIAWPVLKCTVRANGSAIAMSMDNPDQYGPLSAALDAIAEGDPAWTPKWERKYLRVPVEARVKLSTDRSPEPIKANCADLSLNGMFAVTCDSTSKVGDVVRCTILDIDPDPVVLTGKIVRIRAWHDSPQWPGIAIAFDEDGPEPIANAILKSLYAMAFPS